MEGDIISAFESSPERHRLDTQLTLAGRHGRVSCVRFAPTKPHSPALFP